MCDPSLVFGAELMRTINAAHSEDDCGQTKSPRVVHDVLIGCAFGAAVGAVKIQLLIVTDAGGANLFVYRLIALAVQSQIDVLQTAVDLVSRREDNRWRIAGVAHQFKEVQRCARIDIEVINRSGETAGHSNLRREMEYCGGLVDAFGQSLGVTGVGDLE